MIVHFNGRPIEARAGDTVASALFRSGQRIFGRSFKFHRPRGLLCLAGKCPNCMMNVDGTPNVRACVTEVSDGMRVRHQNAWPSLELDALSMVQGLVRLMPVGWYYKSFIDPRIWHAAEPWIRKIAGLGDAPEPRDRYPDYEHTHMQAEVAVIGGGRSGLQAAMEAAGGGEQVVLIDDQSSLGGRSRYEGAVPQELIAQVLATSRVQLIQPASCFGFYEGNLLGVLQPRPHPGAAERLIHLRARRIVIATGAYEVPRSFANNDLVGVMLSGAVIRLIRLHGIVPGKRAVVIGPEDLAADLRSAGLGVVAVVAPESVIAATGSRRVRGIRTRDRHIDCDLIVVSGFQVPDAGLLAQSGTCNQSVTAVGRAAGNTLAGPLTEAPACKTTFVCLCSDVTSQDLSDAIAEGFDHIETLKRYTTATMGPCQGRMCQLPAISICARQTGLTMAETGATTSRPPNPSVTLGALGGPRHHPVRRTPMHDEHDALGAVWMDMGDWKRPRAYGSVEEEYRAVRERAGLIDVSTLGKLAVKGPDTGKLLDKVYTGRFSDPRPGRARYSVLCDEAGTIVDDGTISRLAEDHWFVTTTTGNLDFVQQWLEWWLAGTGWQVYITNLTGGLASVNLAGPKAREVLRKLTDCDLDTKAFPYMACRQALVAGAPAILLRLGFVGETGWEIHVPASSGVALWRSLLEAGAEFGIQPFGVEAQRLLRLEKRHVIVGVDTDALTNPVEAGMAWVVKLDKEDFIGRAALREIAGRKERQRLVGFSLDGGAVPEDGAAVLIDGVLAGRVTSARHSPATGKAIGLAWIPADAAFEGAGIDVRVRGKLVKARVTGQAFYDPEGKCLRL